MKAPLPALAALLAFTACTTATVPGPTLESGPLQGHITGGVYSDKRDWFSVAVPFQKDGELYPYVHVQEVTPANISYVNFMSLENPGEYYRVYAEDFFATNHPIPGMDRVADSVLQVYGRQMVAARGAPLELQQEKDWKAGDTRGLIRLYTQKVPSELLSLDIMQGPGLAEDYTAYILMYVTARNGKVAMVWAEWPEDCKLCIPLPPGTAPAAGADAIDRALALDARVGAFLASFAYGAGASAYQ